MWCGVTHIFQRLLCFYLYNCHQALIRLLQVLCRCLTTELFHWKWWTKAPLACWGELSRLDQLPGIIRRAEKRHNNTMSWKGKLLTRLITSSQGAIPPESKAPVMCQQVSPVQNRKTVDLLLIIQPSLAATLTTGLTPQAAIAATASCIALSGEGGVSPLIRISILPDCGTH